MFNLPTNIILLISMNLSFKDIYKLKQTCKHFYKINHGVKFNLVSRHILKRDFNYDLIDIEIANMVLEFVMYSKYKLYYDEQLITYLLEYIHKFIHR